MSIKLKVITGIILAAGTIAGATYLISSNVVIGGSNNTQNSNANNNSPNTITNNHTTYNFFDSVLRTLGLADEPKVGGVVKTALPSGGEIDAVPRLKLSGGLEAKVALAGRSKDRRSVSIRIDLVNVGKEVVFLTLAGPTIATDDNGGRYDLSVATGLSLCPYRDSTRSCIQSSDVLVGMTQIDPGNSASLNFLLYGNPSNGQLISFSTALVGRTAADASKDGALSDDERKKQLRAFNLSSPLAKITEAP